MSKFRLPGLNALRAFEAAARHQSIKKAGVELHVTATAVTRHIQRLEQQVGRKLFDRRHRQIVLTDAGEILLSAVTSGFSNIQRGFMQLRGNDYSDRLVISVDPDFAALCLVPRLSEFYASVPRTLVEILAERTPLSIQNPRVSCAIQYGPAGLEAENLEFLFRSRLFPVCSQKLLLAHPIITPQDLRQHVLLHDRSIDEWEDYLQIGAPAGDIEVRSGIVFSDTTLCLDAAARGQGVAIGDDYLAAGHLAEGRLVRLFESDFPSKHAYYWVTPENLAVHPTVKSFRAWLKASIAALTEW
jgi:LysR family glycine cleavage system transcriptional activator